MGARKKEALEQFNRDNIIEAAKELFESKGVQETTMDDIATLADYSKSTIYVYFKSKEDIYNSIIGDSLDVLLGELDLCIDANQKFEDCYYQLCDCLVNFCEQYPKYYSSLIFESKATNSRKSANTSLKEMNQEIYEVIEKLVVKGQKDKKLKSDLELKPTVLYIWSSLSGMIMVSEQKKKEIVKDMAMTIEEYRRFVFRTFYSSLIRK